MLTLTAPMEAFRRNQSHRFATCYKITRTDGTIYYLTTHDTVLTLFDDNNYTPVGSFNPTAKRMESSLKDHNIEFQGAITSSVIKTEDLLGDKFANAKVEEYLVDWLYPWQGYFKKTLYWMGESEFNGETWEIDCFGIIGWLKQKVGRVISRTCNAEFGDTRCGVNKDTSSYRATPCTVTTISETDRVFIGSVGTGWGDNFFALGELVWLSGNNSGLKSDVKTFVQSTLTIELILPTEFEMQVGDTFTIYAGCNKLKSTCASKFSNTINFRGSPYTPGTDKLIQTPDSR